MLLAIRACQLDARTALIGLLFGAAVIARLPLLLAAPFFARTSPTGRSARRAATRRSSARSGADRPPAWLTRPDWRAAFELGWPLAAGIAIPLVGYLAYNDLRFGTPFETGYALIPGLLDESQYHDGFFSIVNIPRKLYALFLTGPSRSASSRGSSRAVWAACRSS